MSNLYLLLKTKRETLKNVHVSLLYSIKACKPQKCKQTNKQTVTDISCFCLSFIVMDFWFISIQFPFSFVLVPPVISYYGYWVDCVRSVQVCSVNLVCSLYLRLCLYYSGCIWKLSFRFKSLVFSKSSFYQHWNVRKH